MGDHADDLMEWEEEEREVSILLSQNRAKDKCIAELEVRDVGQLFDSGNQELSDTAISWFARNGYSSPLVQEVARTICDAWFKLATAQGALGEKTEELAQLREENRWIPVEERLPDYADPREKSVLIEDTEGHIVIGLYSEHFGWCSDDHGSHFQAKRWRQIPLSEGPRA